MKEQVDPKNKSKIFDTSETKKLFQKGLKFLALALPLLFASPVLITIGFKALNKGNGYLILVLGCILGALYDRIGYTSVQTYSKSTF